MTMLARQLFRFAAAAALATASFTAHAWAVEPRGQVEVVDEIVTVGDLFADAGEVAGEPVFYAPDPGESVEIGPNFLHRVALGFDLDWQPGTGGVSRVIVRRAAVRIGTDELSPVVLAALGQRIGASFDAAHSQLTFDVGIAAYHLPVGVDPALSARDLSYDPRSQRFTAMVDVAAGTVHASSIRTSGRLRTVVEVPVLTRAVSRNELIGPEDVNWMQIDADRLSSNMVLDVDDLIGFVARRALSPSQPVAQADVQAPVAIQRGQTITMVLESGSITLTAQGRALDNGAVGDTVRILNVQSSRTVEALVEGPGVVRVTAPESAING